MNKKYKTDYNQYLNQHVSIVKGKHEGSHGICVAIFPSKHDFSFKLAKIKPFLPYYVKGTQCDSLPSKGFIYSAVVSIEITATPLNKAKQYIGKYVQVFDSKEECYSECANVLSAHQVDDQCFVRLDNGHTVSADSIIEVTNYGMDYNIYKQQSWTNKRFNKHT